MKSAGVFDDNFDCIIGMAYDQMAVHGTRPFFKTIMDNQLLTRNVFSFYLNNGYKDEKHGLMSQLVLGKIDTSDIEGT